MKPLKTILDSCLSPIFPVIEQSPNIRAYYLLALLLYLTTKDGSSAAIA
ncbi:hypothetical protein H6G27_35150 [Nostoc linckia FACHB-104]|nr:hypothetical protein [Nostoc linckia FACHB-104]